MEWSPQAWIELLKPLAGLVAVIVGGAWTAFVYFDKRRLSLLKRGQEPASPSASSEQYAKPMTRSYGMALPLLVVFAGAALLVWVATGDSCELGDVSSERSWVGCNSNGDITIN